MNNPDPILRGIFPALLTPMTADGSAINYTVLRRLVDFHLERGVTGFFVCGGSGEGLLLTSSERQQVLETVVDQVAGRGTIIAHVGALATATAQSLARHAIQLGVDAVAAVPPVYVRVDRQALLDHYRLIAEAADGTPTYVYNIPTATSVEITAGVMAELIQIPGVLGIKYSSYNLYDLHRITQLRPDLTVLSGFDEVCVAGLAMGAHGAIGSTYNVMPATFSALYRATQTGDWAGAQALQARADKVIDVLVSVPMLAGLKSILSDWGIECGSPRRPQRPLTQTERDALRQAIASVDLEALEQDACRSLAQTSR